VEYGVQVEVTERGAIVRYRGRPSVEGIAEAAQTMADHPAFHAALPAVWDLSEAHEPELSSDDMRRLAPLVAKLRDGSDGRPRVGIVTPSDAAFAGARMFSGVNEPRMRVELGVFRSYEEAAAWAFESAARSTPLEGGAEGDGSSR